MWPLLELSDESSIRPVSFREIDRKAPGVTQECLQIATILLTLQALPVWSHVLQLESQESPDEGQEGTDIPGTATIQSQESTPGLQEPLRWNEWTASADSWTIASIQSAGHHVRMLAEERRTPVVQ